MAKPARATALRHLPNALSAARIAAAPVLVGCALAGAEGVFTVVLVPALVSDILDGYLARRFGLTSRLGALLDSIADLALFVAAVFGVWAFHPALLAEHRLAGLLLVGFWILEVVVAVVRYGRPSSFHTYLSKAAGYLLGFLVGVIFVFGLKAVLLYVAVSVSVLANVEELVLLWLLPAWRSDVRGLYWVLRERSAPS